MLRLTAEAILSSAIPRLLGAWPTLTVSHRPLQILVINLTIGKIQTSKGELVLQTGRLGCGAASAALLQRPSLLQLPGHAWKYAQIKKQTPDKQLGNGRKFFLKENVPFLQSFFSDENHLIIQSKNHRMAWVGRALRYHPISALCLGQGCQPLNQTQLRLLRVPSSLAWGTSRVGASFKRVCLNGPWHHAELLVVFPPKVAGTWRWLLLPLLA